MAIIKIKGEKEATRHRRVVVYLDVSFLLLLLRAGEGGAGEWEDVCREVNYKPQYLANIHLGKGVVATVKNKSSVLYRFKG